MIVILHLQSQKDINIEKVNQNKSFIFFKLKWLIEQAQKEESANLLMISLIQTMTIDSGACTPKRSLTTISEGK